MITRRLIHSFCLLLSAAAVGACDRSTGPRTGSLTVTVNGLPSDVPAVVRITTPKQTVLNATATQTFSNLDPGKYEITASNATTDKSTFAPVSVTSIVDVIAGDTPTQAVVSYNVISAVVSVSITGVPAGAIAFVTLTGTGISRTVSTSSDIDNLVPGTYTVTPGEFDSGELYNGTATPPTLTLSASITPVPVAVAYAPVTGSVTLSSSGLPAGASATWDLSGPGGFTRTLTGSAPITVTHLSPGQYSVAARNIQVGADTYGSSSGSALVTVTAGQSASVVTSFIVKPPSFNLVVAGVYLVQSIQNFSGTVPLIAGRDAYLRVFIRANEINNIGPQVRVRFYRGGQVIATQTIAAPTATVPTANSEATANDSWGAVINGSLLTSGTSMLVDVDPDNAVREVEESDNQYPVNGVPASLDIRDVAPVNLRFVPIATADGFLGNVTPARMAELLNLTLRMHPMSAISPDVRETYQTANVFVDDDTNGAWGKILTEIEVLRITEGSGRYYVGIVKDNGHSKWGGLGYVPGRSVVSIDYGAASEIIAHELGHNWGRFHSPCGGAGGPDPAYPYAGGVIGRYGYDVTYSKILPPTVPDLMGYCWLPTSFNLAAPRQWISDYTYTGVLNYRATHSASIRADESVQECLIIWGRVTAAGIVLEPAFNATTTPVLPNGSGRFNLRATDAEGNVLYSTAFDAQNVADGRETEKHFVFAIPVSQLRSSRLTTLSVAASGLSPAVISSPAATPVSTITATTPSTGFIRLKWNARANPLLVVMDPVTHEIISLAKSGDVTIRTSRKTLSVKASTGTRSIEMQVGQ
jgi:hypothetical protein